MQRLFFVPSLLVLLLTLCACDPNGDGQYSICPSGTVGIDHADATLPELGLDYSILSISPDGSVASSFHLWEGEIIRPREGESVTLYPWVRDPESGIRFAEVAVDGRYACSPHLDLTITEVVDEVVAGYSEPAGRDCGTIQPSLPSYTLAFGGACHPDPNPTGQGTFFVEMTATNHAGYTIISHLAISNEEVLPTILY